MAEQSGPDVVTQSLSVGDSPSGAPEDNSTSFTSAGDHETEKIKSESEGGDKTEQNARLDTVDRTDNQLQGPSHNSTAEPSDPTGEQIGEVDRQAAQTPSDEKSRAEFEGEASKLEPTTSAEDGKGQDAGASRKVASFKPVTFQKYSAPKAAGQNPLAKAGTEKVPASSTNTPTLSMQQGSRPRLVAKTAGGLRDSGSKSFRPARTSTGPDPMQVWNKNRPVVPPSTKNLTDEELKQQFGIHMTSRIEADGESKEAKWADIDDEEDDWAPETLEWADGTKMMLNSNYTAPGAPENANAESNGENPQEQPVAAQQPPVATSIGPNATVLKLGANAERQQAQKSLNLQKGPMEAGSASGMNSIPPAKSPWAALPPVDKTAPIAINPQQFPPQNRFHPMHHGDPQSQQANFGPPPAQEISADDFNRSWRDSQPDQPRELFMPNSGRYEAVNNDNRRRGSRHDQNFRAPAVLQRPPTNDARMSSDTPASFHGGRPSNDQSMWDRRRASSIHSGGSGSLVQSLAGGRTMDGSIGTQGSPSFKQPPQVVDASNPPFPGVIVQPGAPMAPPQPHPSAVPGPSPEKTEEEHKKAIERGRLNIQQRQEEEKKEEAAKRERIRLKMEQLASASENAKVPEPKVEVAVRPEAPLPSIASPPKPPVPEMHGQPKQYGMMKVYHPDTVRVSPPATRTDHSPNLKLSEGIQQPQLEPMSGSHPTVNGIKPASDGINGSVVEPKSFMNESNSQSWGNQPNAPETSSGWAGGNQSTPPIENLWGPLSHDKGLGNGTFDQRLPRITGKEHQQSWLQGRGLSGENIHQAPAQARPSSSEQGQSPAAYSSPEQRPMAANSEVDSFQPVGKPRPIGPPQPRATNPQQRGQAGQSSQNSRWQQSASVRGAPPRTGNVQVSAWNNFHVVAAADDKADREQFETERATRREEEARTGIRQAPKFNFQETWKKVTVGDDRRTTAVAKTTEKPPFDSPTPYAVPTPPPVGNDLPVRAGGSRFFGAETRRATTYGQPDVPPSPSPPPAEEFEGFHPAFDGDKAKPVINLPLPRAVVNLPKALPKDSAPPSPTAPRTFAAAVAAQPPTPSGSRAVSMPANSPDWQNRINNLLGKKSPPKKTIPVASVTREELELMPAFVSAAVSLPPTEVEYADEEESITTKNVEEEEDLFEDRALGSMPSVRVPQIVHSKVLQPHPSHHQRNKLPVPKRELQTVFGSVFENGDDPNSRTNRNKDIHFFVRLPGSESHSTSKLLRKDVKSSNNNNSNSGSGYASSKGPRHNNFNNNNKHNRNNKGGGHAAKTRDSPASFANSAPQNTNNSNSGNSSGGNHRGPNPTSTTSGANANTGTSANGAVPSPRTGGSQGWRPNHFSGSSGQTQGAGVAH